MALKILFTVFVKFFLYTKHMIPYTKGEKENLIRHYQILKIWDKKYHDTIFLFKSITQTNINFYGFSRFSIFWNSAKLSTPSSSLSNFLNTASIFAFCNGIKQRKFLLHFLSQSWFCKSYWFFLATARNMIKRQILILTVL